MLCRWKNPCNNEAPLPHASTGTIFYKDTAWLWAETVTFSYGTYSSGAQSRLGTKHRDDVLLLSHEPRLERIP